MRLRPEAGPQPPTSEEAPAARAARPPVQALGKLSQPRAAGDGRRDSVRVALKAQVDLSSDSNLFTGFGTHISEGGLFVATLSVVPVGTPVDLVFSLPGGTRLSVQGEVRWIREVNDRTPDVFPGVGVRFVELPTEAAEALHRFVQARDPLFYPD
jgi:uncharacterized protein (TIGR02266 family)